MNLYNLGEFPVRGTMKENAVKPQRILLGDRDKTRKDQGGWSSENTKKEKAALREHSKDL